MHPMTPEQAAIVLQMKRDADDRELAKLTPEQRARLLEEIANATQAIRQASADWRVQWARVTEFLEARLMTAVQSEEPSDA